jgi:hypothetical protein
MVRSRVIKIHCALDETQTKKPDIKIKVPLRIARDRSDVMKSWDFDVHQPNNDVRFKSRERSGSEIRTRLSPTPRALYARTSFRT